MSKADNTAYLLAATQERSRSARDRALAAIVQLREASEVITPTAVARISGVSRQWLYACPETLTAIRAAASPPAPPRLVGAAPKASSASMQQRIEALTDDNRRLKRRLADLEQRLASVYGSLRARSTV